MSACLAVAGPARVSKLLSLPLIAFRARHGGQGRRCRGDGRGGVLPGSAGPGRPFVPAKSVILHPSRPLRGPEIPGRVWSRPFQGRLARGSRWSLAGHGRRLSLCCRRLSEQALPSLPFPPLFARCPRPNMCRALGPPPRRLAGSKPEGGVSSRFHTKRGCYRGSLMAGNDLAPLTSPGSARRVDLVPPRPAASLPPRSRSDARLPVSSWRARCPAAASRSSQRPRGCLRLPRPPKMAPRGRPSPRRTPPRSGARLTHRSAASACADRRQGRGHGPQEGPHGGRGRGERRGRGAAAESGGAGGGG